MRKNYYDFVGESECECVCNVYALVDSGTNRKVIHFFYNFMKGKVSSKHLTLYSQHTNKIMDLSIARLFARFVCLIVYSRQFACQLALVSELASIASNALKTTENVMNV